MPQSELPNLVAEETTMVPNRVVVYITMIAFVACGCNAAARRERESAFRQKKEAIEELKRIQVAVHGLQILVSAGLTKQEYSQRLEDTLLKAGDIEQSASENIRKFDPKEQRAAQEIYTHLRQSLLAYQHARDYFGDKFNAPGCEDGCWRLSQQDYEAEKTIFPALTELKQEQEFRDLYPGSPPSYYRKDMLQALWKVAGQEEGAAKVAIDSLNQQAGPPS